LFKEIFTNSNVESALERGRPWSATPPELVPIPRAHRHATECREKPQLLERDSRRGTPSRHQVNSYRSAQGSGADVPANWERTEDERVVGDAGLEPAAFSV
jgi:hypothetical protein